jgi:hypothetical protein
MKKTALMIITALMVSSTLPVLAQEESNQDKVICQLAAKNCLTQSEAFQKRLKKIQKDMAKGKSYSTEDVKQLEQKLKEAQQILDKLEGKAPAK